ncbi:MAG TPA: GTPase-associated system all-helical protein GASH [Pirellulales bacterium]|nr:GTPase-associated system all-helical protein GASH [Pirellulales bacterium]
MHEKGFLQAFLDLQLLEIGDDDARLATLQQASNALSDRLRTDLPALARYTRAALDEKIPPDEPVFDEVEAAIKEVWKTIRNKHRTRPATIIRAVLWDAIQRAANTDKGAATVVYVAKSAVRCSRFGNEEAVCKSFLTALQQRVAADAELEWEGASSLAAPNLPDLPDIKALSHQLMLAVGPEGPDGPVAGANPQWPSANRPWSVEFGPRAARAIAESFSAYGEALFDSLVKLHTQQASIARKTNLLWWAKAQYCLTLNRAFDDFDAHTRTFFLAVDASTIVPGATPPSLEHYLQHVVATQIPNKTIKLSDFVRALTDSNNAPQVIAALAHVPVCSGRCGILAYVKELTSAGSSPSADTFKTRIGIAATTSIPAPELATLVFYELKSHEIANNAP